MVYSLSLRRDDERINSVRVQPKPPPFPQKKREKRNHAKRHACRNRLTAIAINSKHNQRAIIELLRLPPCRRRWVDSLVQRERSASCRIDRHPQTSGTDQEGFHLR